MEEPLINYEFINSQTDNVIGYLSLPADMNPDEQTKQLKKKQAEIAISSKLYIALVYWRKSKN
jgi:hypothetical protein